MSGLVAAVALGLRTFAGHVSGFLAAEADGFFDLGALSGKVSRFVAVEAFFFFLRRVVVTLVSDSDSDFSVSLDRRRFLLISVK